MRYVWVVLLLICCVLDADAAERYASPGGGGNCSSGSPCSLSTGLSQTSVGDTLYLKGGTYNETIGGSQAVSGGTGWGSGQFKTIASAPGETATIQPFSGNMITLGDGAGYIVFDRLIFDGVNIDQGFGLGGGWHHLRVQNSVIKNGKANNVQIGGGAGGSHEFLNNIVHHGGYNFDCTGQPGCGGAGGYGYYIEQDNVLVEGGEIYDHSGYGVQIYSGGRSPNNNIVRGVTIRNNATAVASQSGILVGTGSGNLVYNNIIRNNSHGIQVAFNASNSGIYNNTVYGNPNTGISIGDFGASGTIVRNNIVSSNGGQISNNGSNTSLGINITSDPGFVLAGTDFHIALAGSPAVNCCPRLANVTTDLEGANRSDPTTAGAYEFAAAVCEPSSCPTGCCENGCCPPNPDPDQMLGRLKFDEGTGTTAADSTGNNHPCELTSPGWVSPGILYGSAFSLDGNRSCVIANTTGLNTPDMTVAVWIKGSVLPGPGELGCLFTIGDTFQLCVQPGGSAYFNVITDTYHTLSSPSNVQDGVARLITGVYGPSAGEGQRLYVNESQVGFLAATGNLTYPYGTLSQVGRYFTSGPYGYKGVIQDVMVFNYALDQQAIANIYNNRTPAVNVFSPHMAWVSGTTSAVLGIDTAMDHRIEEPIAVRSSIANSGPEITEFFRLAVCNVTDCDADSDWLEVKPTVNALGVYLDADPSVGLTTNTLQNLNGDGFAYIVGRYVTHIPVVLAWDASTDPQVVGYKVHYGTAPGIYTQVYDAGSSLTATIPGLDLGLTYYFAATAYRADLIESDLSNEVSQSLRNVTTLATGVLTEWEYRRVRFTTPAQIGHQFKFRMLRESSLPLTTYNNTPILTLTGTPTGTPLDFVSGGGSFSGTSNR